MQRFKQAFTIIELLVSVAIIGLLIALLIPNIDRSLNKNQVVNDVDLFKAKMEEVRLLAGSTQQVDEQENSSDANDPVGYYALYIPDESSADYFSIVKIDYPLESNSPVVCSPDAIILGEPSCVIEKINLSRNVTLSWSGVTQFIAFRVPTQKLHKIVMSGTNWVEESPIFDGSVFELNYLTGGGLKATVELDNYTGRVKVTYTNG